MKELVISSLKKNYLQGCRCFIFMTLQIFLASCYGIFFAIMLFMPIYLVDYFTGNKFNEFWDNFYIVVAILVICPISLGCSYHLIKSYMK